MRYIQTLLIITFLIISGAAAINLIVDPANVFREDGLEPERYADTLIASKSGLWWPETSYEDRRIKKALAKYASRFECVVVGSSHIMQISTTDKVPALKGTCRSVLNLGVSGASLEDHITLAYLALRDGRPEKLILGADPWILAFGKGAAWTLYADEFQQAKKEILDRTPQQLKSITDTNVSSRVANLFTLTYTLQSLRKALDGLAGTVDRRAIIPAPLLDANVGGEHPALRPDGSLIYSAKVLADGINPKIPLGGTTYMTGGSLNQERAIAAFTALLRYIKARGSEPILLLTPYHQNVLKGAKSANAIAIQATEPILHDLALAEDIRVIGSYNPIRAGCNDNEFLDFMHARTSCLAKLH